MSIGSILIPVLLAALFTSAPAQSTWSVPELPRGAAVRGVDIVGEGLAVAVGSNGRVLRSTDNGETWSAMQSGLPVDPNSDLRGVSFGTALVGIASGENGTIIATDDGGLTWRNQDAGEFTGQYRPVMIGALHAFIPAHLLTATRDGGTTWFMVTPSAGEHLVDLWMFDTVDGFAVGTTEPDSRVRIVRITDGGRQWTPTDFMLFNGYLNDICFGDARHGYAVGDRGTIARTSDGGQTWTQASSGTTESLLSVAFRDGFNGVAVGSGGMILSTSDGGTTWTREVSGTTAALTGVDYSGSTAIAVGGDSIGIILYSTLPGSSVGEHVDATRAVSLSVRRSRSAESITIDCDLQHRGQTRFDLVDIRGKLLRTISDGMMEQGRHTIHVDVGELPAGPYFVRMIQDDLVQSCGFSR